MIPTILILAVPLGIIFGISHNIRVLAIGSVVTCLGWWALVIVVSDVAITTSVVLVGSVLAVVNLGVGVLAGWGVGRFLRHRFGMTPE